MKRVIAELVHRAVKKELKKYRWVCTGWVWRVGRAKVKEDCLWETTIEPTQCPRCGCRDFRRFIEDDMTKEELQDASKGVWDD